jgi:hypothetical protein
MASAGRKIQMYIKNQVPLHELAVRPSAERARKDGLSAANLAQPRIASHGPSHASQDPDASNFVVVVQAVPAV